MEDFGVVFLLIVGLAVGIAIGLVTLRKPRSEAERAGAEPGFDKLAWVGDAIRRAWSSGPTSESWESLEETLLGADLGVDPTNRVLESVRRAKPESAGDATRLVGEALVAEMGSGGRDLALAGSPAIVLVVGVNGTGKTTTIAKLGHLLMSRGTSVILGAADTFRAGAGNQLKVWGDRLATRVVVGAEGADPASVAYDAVDAGSAAGVDVVIIDTAGRLHGEKNLMAELSKIHRVIGGESGVDEVLLVLDATAGQNGLAQVREFATSVPVSGIVLTKLDGTAKGGIVVTVERELGVPVKYVGVGERLGDLMPFDPREFIGALLGET